jgi:serine/threonine-protein kinase RIO1
MYFIAVSVAIKNANKDYTEILANDCQNVYHEENKQQQMLVRMWGRGEGTLL